MSGADEVFDLSADFVKASVEVRAVVREVIQQGMSEVKDAWRDNARQTSGAHGRLYPNSITYDTRVLADTVIGEVGPDASKPQGGMGRGFEFGSVHQSPHLDGLRAVDSTAGSLERRVSAAIAFVLP